jgi:hypothetical protein
MIVLSLTLNATSKTRSQHTASHIGEVNPKILKGRGEEVSRIQHKTFV